MISERYAPLKNDNVSTPDQITVLHTECVRDDIEENENLDEQRCAAHQFDIKLAEVPQGQEPASLSKREAEPDRRAQCQCGD